MAVADSPELEDLFEREAQRGAAALPNSSLSHAASDLHQQWNALFAGNLSVEEFKHLAQRTRDFLGQMAA